MLNRLNRFCCCVCVCVRLILRVWWMYTVRSIPRRISKFIGILSVRSVVVVLMSFYCNVMCVSAVASPHRSRLLPIPSDSIDFRRVLLCLIFTCVRVCALRLSQVKENRKNNTENSRFVWLLIDCWKEVIRLFGCLSSHPRWGPPSPSPSPFFGKTAIDNDSGGSYGLRGEIFVCLCACVWQITFYSDEIFMNRKPMHLKFSVYMECVCVWTCVESMATSEKVNKNYQRLHTMLGMWRKNCLFGHWNLAQLWFFPQRKLSDSRRMLAVSPLPNQYMLWNRSRRALLPLFVVEIIHIEPVFNSIFSKCLSNPNTNRSKSNTVTFSPKWLSSMEHTHTKRSGVFENRYRN